MRHAPEEYVVWEEDQCLNSEEYQHIEDKEQRVAQKDDWKESG